MQGKEDLSSESVTKVEASELCCIITGIEKHKNHKVR